MNRANIILILRILLGAVFIFSGIAKLDSIYQFEQDIFKAGLTDWTIIPYFSRFMIAAEIFLGICFFHKEGLKKFTIPATFLMLVIFSIHLGYTIITQGGMSGNCGCFGQKLPMTPLESLIKNIVMMGMLVYLYRTPIEKPAREIAIPISLGVLSMILVVFFFPVKAYVTEATVENTTPAPTEIKSASVVLPEDTLVKESPTKDTLKTETPEVKKVVEKTTTKEVKQTKEVTKVEVKLTKETPTDPIPVKEDKPKLLPKITSKYAPFKNFSDGKTIDLDEGIKVVTMYNTGCDHCMENAKKMCELSHKVSLPPVRILFWGNESEIPAFFEFAKCSNPYKFLEPQVFFPLLGKGNFPKIILLNNGNVVGEWEGDDSVEKFESGLKDMGWK